MVPISRLGRPLLSWQFGCKVPVRGSKTDQNSIIMFACYICLYNVCISFDFFLKIKTFKTGMRTSLKQRPNREENVKFLSSSTKRHLRTGSHYVHSLCLK